MANLISACGTFDELCIYYHPMNNRHLGLARIVFTSIKGAQLFIEKYNGKSVMGRVLEVFHDPFGEQCKTLIEEYTIAKKPLPVQVTAPAPAALPSCSIPALNTYEDVNKPEPPALPKAKVDLPPLPKDEPPLENVPEPPPLPMYAQKTNKLGRERRRVDDSDENWDDLVDNGYKETRGTQHERSRSNERRYYDKDRRPHRRHHSRDRSRERRHRRRSDRSPDYYERYCNN